MTVSFPRDELYGLTSQIRRSSTSITANIAEGCGRYTYADKTNKFIIARGECSEVKAFLIISSKLKFIQNDDLKIATEIADKTGRLLSGIIKCCRSNI